MSIIFDGTGILNNRSIDTSLLHSSKQGILKCQTCHMCLVSLNQNGCQEWIRNRLCGPAEYTCDSTG